MSPKQCSLEGTTTIYQLEENNAELYHILNIYNHIYLYFNDQKAYKVILNRSNLIWAMSILCRFFESPAFVDITDKKLFMKEYGNVLAATGLQLGSYVVDDEAYNIESFVIIFNEALKDPKVTKPNIKLMQATILDALDHNLLMTGMTPIEWDTIIPKNIS